MCQCMRTGREILHLNDMRCRVRVLGHDYAAEFGWLKIYWERQWVSNSCWDQLRDEMGYQVVVLTCCEQITHHPEAWSVAAAGIRYRHMYWADHHALLFRSVTPWNIKRHKATRGRSPPPSETFCLIGWGCGGRPSGATADISMFKAVCSTISQKEPRASKSQLDMVFKSEPDGTFQPRLIPPRFSAPLAIIFRTCSNYSFLNPSPLALHLVWRLLVAHNLASHTSRYICTTRQSRSKPR